jgi:hypothetical protein
MHKLSLILGGMALEADFGLFVVYFKVRVVGCFKKRGIRGIGSRKLANPRSQNCRGDEKE